MPAYCTVNGVAVDRAHLTLPRTGVWYADVFLSDGSVPSGSVSLLYGGGRLSGTVRYGGTEDGSGEVHVVGGAGGWPTLVEPKAYRDATRRTVLGELLSAAGERLSNAASPAWLDATLPFWTRMRTTAGVALELLVSMEPGTVWRMLPDGTLFIGAESWPKLNPSHTVLERMPRDFAVRIDMDSPGLLPGCTFAGQRVSAVEYVLTPEDRYATVHFEAP